MKSLPTLLAVFALSALPALAELVTHTVTELRTGTITVNSQIYTIEPHVNLSGANISSEASPA